MMRVLAILSILTLAASAFAQCGTERQAVKTGADPAAARVDLSRATTASIAELRAFKRPAIRRSSERRVAGVEDRTFTVEATLVSYARERDGDLHLILGDGALTLIAEIPSPDCMLFPGPWRDRVTVARRAFERHFAGSHRWHLQQRVRVTGVGFFDVPHRQTGVAPNGIELHPVLDVVFLAGGDR